MEQISDNVDRDTVQEPVIMVWEWASGDVRGIKSLASSCAQASNTGWHVFGVYPKKTKGIDINANDYDILLCRQRPMTEEEKQARKEGAN